MLKSGAFSVAGGSFLALFLLHCGGDSGGPANFDAFLGTWSCDTTTTIKIAMPSGVPDQESTSTVTLEVTKSGPSEITIAESADDSCATKLRVSGTSGKLAAPTTCDQGGITFKVSSADVSASGGKLTGSRSSAVSGTLEGQDASGTGVTKIECTRISGPADAGTGGGGNGGGSGGKAGTGASPGSGGAGAGTDCLTEADCLTCCDDTLGAGASVLDDILLDCACQTCADECASSLCSSSQSNPAPGDACDMCGEAALDSTQPCVQKAVTTCRANAACAAYARCIGACP